MASTTRQFLFGSLTGLLVLAFGTAACSDDVSTSTTGGTGGGTGTGTGSGTATGAGGDGGSGGATGGAMATGGGGMGMGGSGGGGSFACGDMGLMCDAGQICVQNVVTQGPNETVSWACEADPCSPDPLDCSCAMGLCGGGGATCMVDMGVLVCQSGGVCAHPDTPIATPTGERPISSLAVGDLVLSRHDGRLQPVPLLRATRTRVIGHAVVEVALANGRRLLVSAGHPTDDGRRFGDLEVGSDLGGEEVVGLATRSYEESHTYDILPDSDSGTYVAAGALIGSTLR